MLMLRRVMLKLLAMPAHARAGVWDAYVDVVTAVMFQVSDASKLLAMNDGFSYSSLSSPPCSGV